LFGQNGPLLRPDLRSRQPTRAAAVKEARRASRSGAYAQRGFDRDMEVFHAEALQQTENLSSTR
jgi:hypothetical protein